MVFLSFARQSGTRQSVAASGRRLAVGASLLGTAILVSACQSGNPLSGLGGGGATQAPTEQTVAVEDLRAFCPQVSLREGTSSFRTFERGGDGDATKVIYQAAIADVTRSCAYQGQTVTMNVAVAGRIVPGPLGRTGNITLPLRIVVVRGEDVIYTQLHQYAVAVVDVAGATQFVFNDPNVTFELPPDRGVRVFAGFDEGPYDTP
jgi:hypothetical protein